MSHLLAPFVPWNCRSFARQKAGKFHVFTKIRYQQFCDIWKKNFNKRRGFFIVVIFGALQRSCDCPRISSRGTWGLPSLKLRKKVASPELKKAFEEADVAHVTKHETMALGWWTFKKWMVSWVSSIYLTLFRSTPHFVVNVFFTGWRVSDMPWEGRTGRPGSFLRL